MKKTTVKLESLNASKFERFKENEILNMMNVFGGKLFFTNNRTDCWDDSSGNDIKCTDGTKYDVCKTT